MLYAALSLAWSHLCSVLLCPSLNLFAIRAGSSIVKDSWKDLSAWLEWIASFAHTIADYPCQG
jgi:hypothetical protein